MLNEPTPEARGIHGTSLRSNRSAFCPAPQILAVVSIGNDACDLELLILNLEDDKR
jgi:hypothetical protein